MCDDAGHHLADPRLPLIGFMINTLLGITSLKHAGRDHSVAPASHAGMNQGTSARRRLAEVPSC
jgi:hypothetical protein